MIVGGFHKIPIALVTLLDAHEGFSEHPHWSRRLQPHNQTEKSDELQAIVIPIDRSRLPGLRRGPSFDWRFGILVIQTLAEPDAKALEEKEDALLTFVDEIEDFLFATARTVKVNGTDYPIARNAAIEPVADPASITEHHTFVSSVELVVKDQ